MATKKKSGGSWLFAPTKTGLNPDTQSLKIVAMITMLIDHLGVTIFPQYNLMRVIGRMAFPIYCYCIAAGCVNSRDRLRYLMRLTLMGLISQPFYAVALNHTNRAMYAVSLAEHPLRAVLNFYVESWATPNIMMTLALGLLVIWALRERQFIGAVALALLAWKLNGPMSASYGWKGVALIVIFYVLIEHWWLSLPAVLAYMVWWGLQYSGYSAFGLHFGTQMFAILSLPLIYIRTQAIPANLRPLVALVRAAMVFIVLCLLGVNLVTVGIAAGVLVLSYLLAEMKIKINKWVFYLYYPGHLILIMFIKYLLTGNV